MSVDIVPIEESHIEGFHRTLDFVARERRYLSFLEAPPLESVRAFVLDIIKRGRPEFVAVSAGEVVGWCDVLPKDRPIYVRTGVLGMGLLPPFRGQGIGTDLIRRSLAAARAFGLHRVELTVRENNTSAVQLYKKVGFEVEGLQRDAVQVDGVYENVLFMAVLFE
ncbi:MAG: GNAT family N-acetyltransferase [Bradyrhizobium sp.]|uniref:GNAT family N-acetyltransferase n=1 Tax=Bradyrhizobium sp. TaxID=376 RepID=UPI0027241DAC|nr:GNAT family N-acetyltransferase [Bradyrhizobium sp.]MDO8398619.1 GNAT family N-acetyltransferase [Bradyrhizobium sp.]